MKRRFLSVILCLVAIGVLAPAAPGLAAGFADLESEVQQFTLPNGLTFLVLERHDAPVFTFRNERGNVRIAAGSVDVHPPRPRLEFGRSLEHLVVEPVSPQRRDAGNVFGLEGT